MKIIECIIQTRKQIAINLSENDIVYTQYINRSLKAAMDLITMDQNYIICSSVKLNLLHKENEKNVGNGLY